MFIRRQTATSAIAIAGIAVLAVSGASAEIFGTEVGDNQLVTINMETLTGSNIGTYATGSFDLQGLAANSMTGQIYGLSTVTGALYTVDSSTGLATVMTNNLFGGNAVGLAYDRNRDRLWVSDNIGQLSYYDLKTGENGLAGLTSITNIEGLAFDAATDTLYALSDTDNRLYTLDTDTLAATAISDNLGEGLWRGLTFDESSRRLIASRVGTATYMVEFDLDFELIFRSGDITGIGQFTQGLAYVPTPGAISLLGLACLGGMRRHR